MSQLEKKYIGADQVDDSKILLRNNQSLRAKNAAGSGNIDLIKVSTSDILEFQVIPEIPASAGVPTGPKQVATIEQVKNIAAGLRDPKDAVVAASTANVALTGAFPLVVDGVSFAATDADKRILLKSQTAGAENGIYKVVDAGAGNYSLARTSDFDENAEVTHGASTIVMQGTANGNKGFVLTTQDPITIGTTALTFVEVPTAFVLAEGDMTSIVNGNRIDIDLATTSGLESTNPGNAAGQLRVKVHSGLAKDITVKRNASGEVEGLKGKKQLITLAALDITNQYVDLAEVAHMDSIKLVPVKGIEQIETIDFSVSYTGGASGKTRITFLGDLATGGAAALVANDKLAISYQYL